METGIIAVVTLAIIAFCIWILRIQQKSGDEIKNILYKNKTDLEVTNAKFTEAAIQQNKDRADIDAMSDDALDAELYNKKL